MLQKNETWCIKITQLNWCQSNPILHRDGRPTSLCLSLERPSLAVGEMAGTATTCPKSIYSNCPETINCSFVDTGVDIHKFFRARCRVMARGVDYCKAIGKRALHGNTLDPEPTQDLPMPGAPCKMRPLKSGYEPPTTPSTSCMGKGGELERRRKW